MQSKHDAQNNQWCKRRYESAKTKDGATASSCHWVVKGNVLVACCATLDDDRQGLSSSHLVVCFALGKWTLDNNRLGISHLVVYRTWSHNLFLTQPPGNMDECPVCFEPMDTQIRVTLPCYHCLCLTCLLRLSHPQRCPLCRKNVAPLIPWYVPIAFSDTLIPRSPLTHSTTSALVRELARSQPAPPRFVQEIIDVVDAAGGPPANGNVLPRTVRRPWLFRAFPR